MKRYIIYSLVILMTLLTFGTACSKFEDMNKNPYVLYDAPSESFVHPIMFKTQSNNMTVFRNITARLMQYAVATGASTSSRVVDLYSIPETTTDDNWAAVVTAFVDGWASEYALANG